MPRTTTFVGTDAERLDQLRRRRSDHRGLPVTPFVDEDGGWPLRCCLHDSEPGDLLAVAWSPFATEAVYATTGPVVVHVEACPEPSAGEFPGQFEQRPQVVRAYDADRRLVYDLNRIVAAGAGLRRYMEEVLDDSRVELVQAFNVVPGCYSFSARRVVADH